MIGASNSFWLKPDRSSLTSTARGFFPSNNSQVRILNPRTSGHFAVVTFQSGHIEGGLYNGQLLEEKFPFGWQVVDLATTGFATGQLLNHGISAASATYLHEGSTGGDSRASVCPDNCKSDSGRFSDIVAIRSLMLLTPNEAIGPVVVSSTYAMAEWWGNGGGEMLFTSTHWRWKILSGGGGCWNIAELVEHRVPIANAKVLIRRFPCGP